jgi:ATP-dependent exoDNAse (exonuclease V) alpha subunit
MRIRPLSRGGGRDGNSATSAAAYRAGERIHDERSGRTFDHTYRRDVMHAQIVLPSKFAEDEMSWAQDRQTLWNAAEKAERASNSRVARRYTFGLPAELNHEQRVELVRGFSQSIADRYTNVVDFAIHEPVSGGDHRNFHAHLLTTTRELRLETFGEKTLTEIDSRTRRMRGLDVASDEHRWTAQHWAQHTNEAFRHAGLAIRIDHRSLSAQGIDREPLPEIPVWALALERRGERSIVAERLREEYDHRVAARHERAHRIELDAGIDRGRSGPTVVDRARPIDRESVPGASEKLSKLGFDLQNPEQVRRRAREEWLHMRSDYVAQSDSKPHSAALRRQLSRDRDEDIEP